MQPKKILITGSSGFMGSHVADSLLKNNIEIRLFDKSTSKYNNTKVEEKIGSILNRGDVDEAVDGCDCIYHFAAQADIELSSRKPSDTIYANIIGTQNLLEASRKFGVKRFVFASTIYVYSELGSFYRVSKQACEKIIEEYEKEFNIDYTILRFGSLYGPRANEFNGIRNFLTQAIRDKKIIRRGDGEEIREYIHAEDAAILAVNALEDSYRNKHLIITGNEQIRVKDLLFMIKEIFKGSIDITFGHEKELHHYQITPYSYKPELAKKLTPKTYYDLGQGLLDQLYDLEIEHKTDLLSNRISLRKRIK